MEPTDQEIIDYLLGDIAEPDQLRVEESLFAGDDFFERLSATENRLIDLYVLDKLSASERSAFEKKYLVSPRRQAAVATSTQFIQLLDTYRRCQPPKSRKGWLGLRSFISSYSFALQASLATLLAIVSVPSIWLVGERARLKSRTEAAEAALRQKEEESRRERTTTEQLAKVLARNQAELDRKLRELQASEASLKQREAELTALEARAANGGGGRQALFATFVLASVPRSIDQPAPELLIRPNHRFVNLVADLNRQKPAERYRASLQRVDGQKVWTKILPKPRRKRRQLTFVVPSSVFRDHSYFVKVEGLSQAGQPVSSVEYSLAVRKEGFRR
jgi:hypothetical protein